LADAFVTAMIPFYALAVAAVFPLRRRGAVSAYRTPGYPIVPLLFIASVLYLMINGLAAPESRRTTAIIFGVILLGIPVYYLVERRRRT
jgi:hypothetical protein